MYAQFWFARHMYVGVAPEDNEKLLEYWLAQSVEPKII